MPISYRIDPSRKLVLTTATGVLTDDDLIRHKQRLVADPAFQPGMRQLSDVRGVTDLQVTPLGVRLMVAADEGHAAALAGHRLAIVVSKDLAFGMARSTRCWPRTPPRASGCFGRSRKLRPGLGPEGEGGPGPRLWRQWRSRGPRDRDPGPGDTTWQPPYRRPPRSSPLSPSDLTSVTLVTSDGLTRSARASSCQSDTDYSPRTLTITRFRR